MSSVSNAFLSEQEVMIRESARRVAEEVVAVTAAHIPGSWPQRLELHTTAARYSRAITASPSVRRPSRNIGTLKNSTSSTAMAHW